MKSKIIHIIHACDEWLCRLSLRQALTVSVGSGAIVFSILTVMSLSGCSMFGTNPSPPTKAESLIYNTVTNYVPVVVPSYVTNQVTVTSYATNVVPVTVAAVTNLQPQYVETVKPGVASGIAAGGGVLNVLLPGMGGLISTGVTALLGLWGYLRSSKQSSANYDTGAALAQEIEIIRSFIKTLPNGATIDNTLTNFIQAHQADSGVLTQVLNLLASEVSNKDASTAAQQIAQTVAGLVSTNPPAATKV
jgi:hypothetical protein